MLTALLIAALFSTQGPNKDLTMELRDPNTGETSALALQRSERLEDPKLSPKVFDGKKWEFDWLTAGYGLPVANGQMELRFRIYSQERKPGKDIALEVAAMDLRMWQLLNHKYKIDHADVDKGLRLVDEYLCWGGEAGGEQTMGEDVEGGHVRRANTIYIYDIASFKDPMEMAREVAHEYGHAVLPAVGGFRTPEDWANGYLGERLFLRWLRDASETGRIDQGSTMGASFQSLDKWVHTNVDPLVVDAASHAPDKTILGGSGQKAMNAYMGLVLYADSVLPNQVVARSFKLTGSTSATDYPAALVEAASEGSFTLTIPNLLYGKKLWLPLGKSKVQGATVVVRKGAWAQVLPSSSSVIILAPGT